MLFYREAVGWRRWTAIGVGFFGALLVIKPMPSAFDVWALVAAGSALFAALREILTRHIGRAVPVMVVAFWGLTGEPPPPAAVAPAAPVVSWLSSRGSAQACPGCGTAGPGEGGYCDHCGRRWLAGRDRAELDLGVVAGVTDRARRRRNEDAFAIGRLDAGSAAVVCDGVSTSARSDVAANAAAEAGIAALLAALDAGAEPEAATAQAARAAAYAVRAVAEPHDQDAPPSCTYVSAVVTAETVTVGWIGDSRAYWLGAAPGDAACLTIDDSLAGRLAAGRPAPPAPGADPRSRALIRWLGADSSDEEPDVTTVRPIGPGRLVLCSDGLSHYLSEPEAMAAAVAGPPAAPVDVARSLTRTALDAGGHDNIAVVVLPFPPADGDHTLEGSVR